jgi:hypothetical protein
MQEHHRFAVGPPALLEPDSMTRVHGEVATIKGLQSGKG